MKKVICLIISLCFIFTNVVFGLEEIDALETSKQEFFVSSRIDKKDMKDTVTFRLSSFSKDDDVFIEVYDSVKTPIVKEQFTNDSLEIKNLKRDVIYQFNLRINKNEFVGDILLWEDFDNKELEVIMSNLISSSEYSTTSKSTRYESESNDLMNDADTIYDDDDVYGYIGSTSDVDWFRVKFNENGRANFWVDVPNDKDYDLYLYDSAGILIDESEKGDLSQV